nr:MAG TPA: hypothetical protein [Caudoviricetes sp.]
MFSSCTLSFSSFNLNNRLISYFTTSLRCFSNN